MTSRVDLHTHSKASDGQLSPSELVRRAHENGVRHLALTDHDTTAGIPEARAAAVESGVNLIPGVELSVTWENRCLHVVGLGIDPRNAALATGLESLQNLRVERASEMGRRLEKKGIIGALEGALQLAGDGMITRTHFAKYLVDQNHCASIQKAFDRYLSRGKAGFVPTPWVALEKGIEWIKTAGGTAVLAHPQRYKLTGSRMRGLLSAFRAAGGQAIEVVCGNSNRDEIRDCARYAQEFELLGSVGSDFHSPDCPWTDIGRLKAFPKNVEPVWIKFGIELTGLLN